MDRAEEHDLSLEHVAEAVLHLARLAAAHAKHGVGWIDVQGDRMTTRELDPASLAVLAEVTRLLREDRERVGKLVAQVLLARVHEIAEQEFWRVRREPFDPASERQVEDRIEESLHQQLAVVMSDDQKKRFAVDDEYIRKKKGASNAAAEVIGEVLSLKTGHAVYTSKKAAGAAPPVPGPLNRWVSLRAVGEYLQKVLEGADAVRQNTTELPVDALRSPERIEAFMDRADRIFRKRVSTGLEGVAPTFGAPFFLSLLRGENPAPHLLLEPEIEQEWAIIRPKFAELGDALRQEARRQGVAEEAVLTGVAERFSLMMIERVREVVEIP